MCKNAIKSPEPEEKKMEITRENYDKLKKEINFHNYQYHVNDAPLISDSEFDHLLIELREI